MLQRWEGSLHAHTSNSAICNQALDLPAILQPVSLSLLLGVRLQLLLWRQRCPCHEDGQDGDRRQGEQEQCWLRRGRGACGRRQRERDLAGSRPLVANLHADQRTCLHTVRCLLLLTTCVLAILPCCLLRSN